MNDLIVPFSKENLNFCKGCKFFHKTSRNGNGEIYFCKLGYLLGYSDLEKENYLKKDFLPSECSYKLEQFFTSLNI